MVTRGDIDVNFENENGETPLCVAINYGEKRLVKSLIEAGADVNKYVSSYDQRPIFVAAINRNLEVLHSLLNSGADVHAETLYGGNVIHKLVCRDFSVEIFQSILPVLDFFYDQRVNFNKQDYYGQTPLHVLGQKYRYEWGENFFNFFINKYNVKIDIKDNQGKTPYDVLREQGYFSSENN